MMKSLKYLKAGLSAAALSAALASTAHAGGGVFDALDPCIKMKDEFRAERASVLQVLDKNVQDADRIVTMPAGYEQAWREVQYRELRASFDTSIAPVLKDNGVTDINAAYDKWFKQRLESLKPGALDKLIADSFQQDLKALKELRANERAQGRAAFETQAADLNKTCKADVGSQALRGTLTIVLAPFNYASRNAELAKNETGAGAKVLALGTGISVDAINANGGVFGGGLSGGKNSVFRKAGIRF